MAILGALHTGSSQAGTIFLTRKGEITSDLIKFLTKSKLKGINKSIDYDPAESRQNKHLAYIQV